MGRRQPSTRRAGARNHGLRSSASQRADSDIHRRSSISPDELWLSLRQGARNVAGVRWQVAVSVHLLVAARAGRLPFVRLIPEGNEDLDCHHADGRATLVQMKEVGGGAGRLTASDVADALAHADEAVGESAVALVTDGDLGSGLLFTGWDSVLAMQGGQPAEDVARHLVDRGLTQARAEVLLQQTRLVSLPWNVREETERLLANAMGYIRRSRPSRSGCCTSGLGRRLPTSGRPLATSRERALPPRLMWPSRSCSPRSMSLVWTPPQQQARASPQTTCIRAT